MVLLVDDQVIFAEMLRRFLADDSNLALHHCPNPEDAISIANRITPTVILLDLILPNTDGMAVLSRLRANPQTKETPIIVLSTREDAETKSLAFSLGANDYLVKLPEKLEMIARVRYHSGACINRLERDEAFNALRESQRQLMESNTALLATNQKLGEALSQVKQLRGLLPICCYCKRVRNDGEYWSQIEAYLSEHSDLRLSHSVCDDCFEVQMESLSSPKETAASPRGGLAVAAAPIDWAGCWA